MNEVRTITPTPWNWQILEPRLSRTLLHLRQAGECLALERRRYGCFFGSALGHRPGAFDALFVHAFREAAGLGCEAVWYQWMMRKKGEAVEKRGVVGRKGATRRKGGEEGVPTTVAAAERTRG